MAFQISRVVLVNGTQVPANDIGSPLPSREQAEEKLLETQKSLGRAGHRFEIREVEETSRMRESWVRNRLLPAVVFKKAEDITPVSNEVHEQPQPAKKTHFRKFYEQVLPTIKLLFGTREQKPITALSEQKSSIALPVPKHRNSVSRRIFEDGKEL